MSLQGRSEARHWIPAKGGTDLLYYNKVNPQVSESAYSLEVAAIRTTGNARVSLYFICVNSIVWFPKAEDGKKTIRLEIDSFGSKNVNRGGKFSGGAWAAMLCIKHVDKNSTIPQPPPLVDTLSNLTVDRSWTTHYLSK